MPNPAKLLLIAICLILLNGASVKAEDVKHALNPTAFYQRSVTPNLAYYILSRSTGLPYNPPKPPTTPLPPTTPIRPSPPIPPDELAHRLEPKREAAPLPQPDFDAPTGLDVNVLDRLKKYDTLIRRYSRLNAIDPNLTRAVIYVESGGDNQAQSSKGAQGLMQLMPDTANDMGVSNAFDPAQNIFGGTRYISRMLDQFGSLDLALWAYNAGPEAVKNKRLPLQTRQYIPSVIRVKRLLDRRDH